MRFALMSIPRSRITRTALGCSGFGMAPGAGGVDRALRHVLEQRLGDLRARAVPRAQEQHPRLAPRAARRRARSGRRRREPTAPGCSAPPAACSCSPAAREVDRVVAVASVGRAATRGDEPAVAQLAQVVRHQALRLADELGQLPHGPVAAHELAEQPPPQRMCHQPHEPRRVIRWARTSRCLARNHHTPRPAIQSSWFD